MELKDFVGNCWLSGVDYELKTITYHPGEKINWDENCQIIRFVLDGVTYCVIEDPKDGYRSGMRAVQFSESSPKNIFPPQDVVCKYINENEYGKCDILEIYDAKNEKLVLRVGTENIDDYYPGFIGEWIPENMSINEGK